MLDKQMDFRAGIRRPVGIGPSCTTPGVIAGSGQERGRSSEHAGAPLTIIHDTRLEVADKILARRTRTRRNVGFIGVLVVEQKPEFEAGIGNDRAETRSYRSIAPDRTRRYSFIVRFHKSQRLSKRRMLITIEDAIDDVIILSFFVEPSPCIAHDGFRIGAVHGWSDSDIDRGEPPLPANLLEIQACGFRILAHYEDTIVWLSSGTTAVQIRTTSRSRFPLAYRFRHEYWIESQAMEWRRNARSNNSGPMLRRCVEDESPSEGTVASLRHASFR